MSPSTRATWSEAATSTDLVTFLEFATTLNPRSTNPFTTPAPMPCEAPVTRATLRSVLTATSLWRNNSLAGESVLVRRSELADVVPQPGFDVPRLVEAAVEQHPDSRLGGGPSQRGEEGAPLGR